MPSPRDVVVQAFWQRIARLDTAISPRMLHSPTFRPADCFRLLPFAWAVACIAISQAQPFPFLTILKTSLLYSIGLSIPLIAQFLWPASQVVIYAWTLYWFRISLPLHLTVVLFPLLSLALWLFGPDSSLQYFAFLTGYANLMVAMTFIVLRTTWSPPAKVPITYTALFAGLNTGLQMVNLTYFFPHLKSFAVPLCVLSVLHGGLQDPFGFAAGVVTAVSSFHHLIPNELRVSPIPDSPSSSSSSLLESGIKKSPEAQEMPLSPRTVAAAFDVMEPETTHTQPPSSAISIPLAASVSPPATENQFPTMASQPTGTQRLPIIERVMPETSQNGLSDGGGGSKDVPSSEPSVRARRRPSVGGPREPRYRPRPASIASIPTTTTATTNARAATRLLPTPPQTAPHHRTSMMAPELQARWNDNLFELQDRLGESSSRVTFKVREKRSGLLYVRKTFHARQTSGSHILRHLFELVARQDDAPDATSSSNVIRCYGAYFPDVEDDAVRGIFEFCQGGSLHSISSVITQRGGIVGEKIAGRIASGILQGLNFLHGLNMVHFNVRPSNVFITQSGMVKLSEPEIPGEGAVALTDRFVKSVGYASPERITGNPVNPAKSDVWALGITLLEFVQNRYPYPELPTIELMVRIVQGEPPYLQDGTNATYTPKMKNFFTQCLLMDETRRPTAQELLSNAWVLSVANQNVRMDKWIREVWS